MGEPPLEARWQVANEDPSADLVEVLLKQRGYASGPARERFLSPSFERDGHDPFLLPDMELAVARLQWAFKWRELIVVYGDYDADGVTATVLLYEALEQMGARVAYILPHRLKSGYGLSAEGVDTAVSWGAGVIVTVDNGTAAMEAAEQAAECDLDLIITDHHQPRAKLPIAHAHINPNLAGAGYPFGGISGVGVALKLALALRGVGESSAKAGPTDGELELAALGTVADVSPLVDENRALVREGLANLDRTQRPGLAALLKSTGQAGKVDTIDVGFKLAPRLNAVGRMEAADVAVELLLSRESDQCAKLARKLELINQHRKTVTEDNTALALTLVEQAPDRPFVVVHHPSFHPGVVGLVAGRLVETFNRPALALAKVNDGLAGSARSLPGFDVASALARCSDLLISHGGHPAAAGLKVAAERLAELTERLNSLAEGFGGEGFSPELPVDSLVDPDLLVVGLVDELDRLAPFGRANPQPVLALPEVKLGRVMTMGRGRNHLRLELTAGSRRLKAVGWNLGAWQGRLRPGRNIGVAFTLEKEHWRGREGLQLTIKGLLSAPYD